jgi:ketosteroid isomerase-like protein
VVSEQNVEIVRRRNDAADRRDAEATLSAYDPDVELDASRLGVAGLAGRGRVYHGHEGLRIFFREWHEAWEQVEYRCEELIDAGEHVISLMTYRGRGRVSGAEVELPVAIVETFNEGKIARVVWFLTREDALQAAGLAK